MYYFVLIILYYFILIQLINYEVDIIIGLFCRYVRVKFNVLFKIIQQVRVENLGRVFFFNYVFRNEDSYRGVNWIFLYYCLVLILS